MPGGKYRGYWLTALREYCEWYGYWLVPGSCRTVTSRDFFKYSVWEFHCSELLSSRFVLRVLWKPRYKQSRGESCSYHYLWYTRSEQPQYFPSVVRIIFIRNSLLYLMYNYSLLLYQSLSLAATIAADRILRHSVSSRSIRGGGKIRGHKLNTI